MAPYYVIHQMLVDANSFDPDRLLNAFSSIFIPNTVWGPIQLDVFGQNAAKEMGNYQMVVKGARSRTGKRQSSSGNITLGNSFLLA